MTGLKRHWKKGVMSLIVLIGLTIIGGLIFLKKNTSQAMDEAQTLIDEDVIVQEHDLLIVEPEGDSIGNLVFYQGGLVEPTAYLPLAVGLSEEGWRVFLPSMPLNLSILGTDRFDSIYETYPSNEEWWIGGHSLGGTGSLIYADEKGNRLAGIMLLASYPGESTDLSQSPLPILSITGTQDRVIDSKQYEETKNLLPDHTQFLEIEEGNHSSFGYYGFQSGDGESFITREEQHQQVIEAFLEMTQE
ncbi:alpha/beta hydrolase [Alkalibacterium sp. MB6]|uniref:alpha/beta hydrolase n=1 Tax=Alkalibacterium sp. MB6 TaxID=2081965 RepID=UPI00137AFF31|nr:alpha/beta hydrolase [Alkalibacterium sp. MB6]